MYFYFCPLSKRKKEEKKKRNKSYLAFPATPQNPKTDKSRRGPYGPSGPLGPGSHYSHRSHQVTTKQLRTEASKNTEKRPCFLLSSVSRAVESAFSQRPKQKLKQKHSALCLHHPHHISTPSFIFLFSCSLRQLL